MRYVAFLLVCIAGLLASSLTPAFADKRVALVIGNSAYENVQHLPNPVNDAEDMATALEKIGFTVKTATDLDFNGMRRALRDFGDDAAGADMAAIFFAGHGMEVDKQNYLIPVDARLNTDRDVALEAIPLDYLLRAVEGARGLKLVFLDACRNNPFAASIRMTSATRSVGRGLSPVDPAGGILVSYSAKDGSVAQDGDGRNSPYTAALLSHLLEPGTEIRLLFGEVHDAVLAATGNRQEPFTYGALGGKSIYLVSPTNSSPEPNSTIDPITYNQARDFVEMLNSPNTVNDLDNFVRTHYAPFVDYYGKTTLSRSDVLKDKKEWFSRWKSWHILTKTNTISLQQLDINIYKLTYDFDYSWTEQNLTTNQSKTYFGVATAERYIKRNSDTIQIFSENTHVLERNVK